MKSALVNAGMIAAALAVTGCASNRVHKGAVIDPQGPSSNPIGLKVIRGGGYDFADGLAPPLTRQLANAALYEISGSVTRIRQAK